MITLVVVPFVSVSHWSTDVTAEQHRLLISTFLDLCMSSAGSGCVWYWLWGIERNNLLQYDVIQEQLEAG